MKKIKYKEFNTPSYIYKYCKINDIFYGMFLKYFNRIHDIKKLNYADYNYKKQVVGYYFIYDK